MTSQRGAKITRSHPQWRNGCRSYFALSENWRHRLSFRELRKPLKCPCPAKSALDASWVAASGWTETMADNYDIFFSYSRRDTQVILPILQLLHAAGRNVFLDIDSIKPGK